MSVHGEIPVCFSFGSGARFLVLHWVWARILLEAMSNAAPCHHVGFPVLRETVMMVLSSSCGYSRILDRKTLPQILKANPLLPLATMPLKSLINLSFDGIWTVWPLNHGESHAHCILFFCRVCKHVVEHFLAELGCCHFQLTPSTPIPSVPGTIFMHNTSIICSVVVGKSSLQVTCLNSSHIWALSFSESHPCRLIGGK